MTEKVKQRRNRRCNPLSIKHRCRAIADAIGCHHSTAEKWYFEGRLQYRILRFLLERNPDLMPLE